MLALRNTFVLGVLAATIGTAMALVIGYVIARKAVPGHRILGFLATAPIAIPGIVLGVGLFISLRAAGRPSCSTARCGSCSSPS